MAYTAIFSEDEFLVPDQIIPGNSQSSTPVKFHLSMAGGPDFARLKSVVYGTASVGGKNWSDKTQAATMRSFETAAGAFARAVEKIENYSVPVRMARKVGIIPAFVPGSTDARGLPDDATYPIVNGEQFSRIAPYQLVLAMSVALAIIKVTNAANLDPRLFVLPSGSSSPEPRAKKTSIARSARRERGRRATAD